MVLQQLKNSMGITETYIYGASGHGKVILDILESQGIELTGFIDDDLSKNVFAGYTVFRVDQVKHASARIVMGIGSNNIRKMAVEKATMPFINAVHSTAVVSPKSQIGTGTVVMQMAVVQAGTKTGRHCIINTAASVDHDCNLGDFVHISPGAILCGNVTVGDLTWVGAGATVIQGITIGSNVKIGAGAVIIRDVPDNVTVVGNPGRMIGSRD